MFITMGLVHLVACVALILGAPDSIEAIWGQFIGGSIELAIGVYFLIKNEEFI